MSLTAMKQCWADDFPADCPGVSRALVRAVALALADHVNDANDNLFYGSVTNLAIKADVTRKVAVKVMNHLSESGVIELITERRGRTNLYQWHMTPEGSGRRERGVRGCSQRGQHLTPEGSRTQKNPTRTQETLEGFAAPPPRELTAGQVAHMIQRGYWDWVREKSGRYPIAMNVPAFKAIVTPFLEAGVDGPAIKQAVAAMYERGTTLTKASLERELDGRGATRKDRARLSTATLRFDEEGNRIR